MNPQLYPGQREHFQDVPRLAPGTRVRYQYDTNDAVQFGIVVNLNATQYAHYPAGHPWTCPDYATPVKWDHDNRISWVRSCCLSLPEPPEPATPINWPVDYQPRTPRIRYAKPGKTPTIRKRSPNTSVTGDQLQQPAQPSQLDLQFS